MSEDRRKTDKLIWYFMITAVSIIIIGGGAWASNINIKVDKIAGLEVNIQYIKEDISLIRKLLYETIKKRE